MIRWLSTSLALSASRMRTPKMAPVDPVMPMIRRRIRNSPPSRDMAGLLGMAGITLGDGNAEEEPRVADLMRPGRSHARHPRLGDALAQQSRAQHCAITADLVGRALGHAAQQNGVVAIVDRLHV